MADEPTQVAPVDPVATDESDPNAATTVHFPSHVPGAPIVNPPDDDSTAQAEAEKLKAAEVNARLAEEAGTAPPVTYVPLVTVDAESTYATKDNILFPSGSPEEAAVAQAVADRTSDESKLIARVEQDEADVVAYLRAREAENVDLAKLRAEAEAAVPADVKPASGVDSPPADDGVKSTDVPLAPAPLGQPEATPPQKPGIQSDSAAQVETPEEEAAEEASEKE